MNKKTLAKFLLGTLVIPGMVSGTVMPANAARRIVPCRFNRLKKIHKAQVKKPTAIHKNINHLSNDELAEFVVDYMSPSIKILLEEGKVASPRWTIRSFLAKSLGKGLTANDLDDIVFKVLNNLRGIYENAVLLNDKQAIEFSKRLASGKGSLNNIIVPEEDYLTDEQRKELITSIVENSNSFLK